VAAVLDELLGERALRGELARALDEPSPDPAAAAWRRAWLLAAAGSYAEALQHLEAADQHADAALGAAAGVTRASVLRQLALHERAEAQDVRSLALLDVAPPDHPARRDLLAAGRIGLAADAVGTDPGNGALLDWRLADARAVAAGAGARQQVRLAWVSGEVELCRGNWAGAARAFAEARDRSVQLGARRHEAKSLLFLAGACAAEGSTEAASAHARTAEELARVCGAGPLVWPALLVQAEAAGRSGRVDQSERLLDLAADELRPLLEGLPPDLAADARARPPAAWLLARPRRR
jgi:tetratricopeptide (TPR) repeat protein